jgi:hypothetical protein
MRKLLLATVAVLCLATPAFAGHQKQDVQQPEHVANSPSTVMNTLSYKQDSKVTREGCLNYALDTFAKAGFHDVSVSGDNSIWAVSTVQDNDYVIGVWCQMDDNAKFIVFVVSGKTGEGSHGVQEALEVAWHGDKK